MIPKTISGKTYKLPNELNSFQLDMYVHLINWKWKYITTSPGFNGSIEYDAILPTSVASGYPLIYPSCLPVFLTHHSKYLFRIHKFFDHMASSQAANINLFLPILTHSRADDILQIIKPDFNRLAKDTLVKGKSDDGYRIEFWDEPNNNLNDKKDVSGTDSDIAISYYNNENELCLWLVEHKLTESEFTGCGGFKSKGRKAIHDCSKGFSDIIKNKDYCYYHNVRKFNYWRITDAHLRYFPNHTHHENCPFQGGLNQLWRNQLLGLSIEDDPRQPYKHVYFSVVKHPDNHSLDKSIADYKGLINYNPKFSVLSSLDFINATNSFGDATLNNWIDWYKELYKL